MNIGVDCTPLKECLTGVGNYVFYLLEGLIQKRREDHFYLYAIKDSSSLDHFRRFSNATVRILPFLGISEALWSQTTLPWQCWKDKIDLFWGTTQSVPLVGKWKSLITIHDFAYRLYPETVSRVRGAYLRCLGRWLYKKANGISVNSKGTAARLKQLYGLEADRVVIPPLKNLSIPSNEEVGRCLKEYALIEKKYYLMIGTLEPRKNVVPLLRAYASIDPLVLVGAKGWRDSRIAEEIQQSKKAIRVLGYLPDPVLNALVRGAKACIMPSLYEGYGMPIAEARVLGTPVICCDVPEMIEAAEEDAHIIGRDELGKAFEMTLSSPKKPNYPSNEWLATSLSEEISRLLQPSPNCD